MKSAEKTAALDKCRMLLLATYDYVLGTVTDYTSEEDFELIRDYYQQQKIQVEKYYRQRRLDRLQQKLNFITEQRMRRADLDFNTYIKDSTGYDIDIFEDLEKRVDAILSTGEPKEAKESMDLHTMMQVYLWRGDHPEKVDLLKKLILKLHEQNPIDFSNQKMKMEAKVTTIYVDIINEVDSPDGKSRLMVTQTVPTEMNQQTMVIVRFQHTSENIYAVSGINPHIHAYWKDNNSIVVASGKNDSIIYKHEKVQNYRQVLTIAYTES